MQNRLRSTAAVLVVSLNVVAATTELQAQQKAQIPASQALVVAQQLAREVYAARFRQAKTSEEKTSLAAEMIDAAAACPNGSADQYVVLKIARDIAAGAGDTTTAIKAVECLALRFDVPLANQKAQSLVMAAGRATTPSQQKAVAEAALPVVVELAAAGEYGTATDLCEAARDCAQQAKQADLIGQLTAKIDELNEQQRAAGTFEEAMTVLKNDVSEPRANLTAGSYLCFVKGDWERGIPYLALGNDEQLKTVALIDQRGANSAQDQVSLGDTWWSLAEERQGPERDALRFRAGFWYQKAQPNLAGGLASLKVRRRLEELVKGNQDIPIASKLPDGGAFSSRQDPVKSALLNRLGGSDASEAAVAAALRWIADHQLPDGGWSFDHRTGSILNDRPRTSDHPGTSSQARRAATAMAVLPFLGAGQTHKDGTYKTTVQGGLSYLISNMKPDGSLHESQGNMYSHGLAAIALCEAYAMTGDTALKTSAQASLNFIAYAQDPVGGGWRYSPRQPGDTSVFSWQMTAIKIGEAAKLRIKPLTLSGANKFLDTVQANGGAFYGYTDPGQGPATTAIGLLCRMYLGWKHENEALKRGVEWLSNQGPSLGNGANMYYNYYGTQVCRQYGGEVWEKWNSKMRDFLVKSQAKQMPEEGSWYFAGGHGSEAGGRLYNTSLATLVLEEYYRDMELSEARPE